MLGLFLEIESLWVRLVFIAGVRGVLVLMVWRLGPMRCCYVRGMRMVWLVILLTILLILLLNLSFSKNQFSLRLGRV